MGHCSYGTQLQPEVSWNKTLLHSKYLHEVTHEQNVALVTPGGGAQLMTRPLTAPPPPVLAHADSLACSHKNMKYNELELRGVITPSLLVSHFAKKRILLLLTNGTNCTFTCNFCLYIKELQWLRVKLLGLTYWMWTVDRNTHKQTDRHICSLIYKNI